MTTTGETSLPRRGVWLGLDSLVSAELAARSGFTVALLDAEHGPVDDRAAHHLIPVLKSLGLDVWVKVMDGSRSQVQRPLDFGADAIVFPHVDSAATARQMTSYGKFPPLGDRSLSAERAADYLGHTAQWIKEQNASTMSVVMIEDADGLLNIDDILAIDTVDYVMPGPSDLAIRRGRASYARSDDDFADLQRIARACNAAGKPWALPAWTEVEQQFARDNGADLVFNASDYAALKIGYETLNRIADQAFSR